MSKLKSGLLALLLATATYSVDGGLSAASAASASDLDQDAQQALHMLYRTNPAARRLGHEARAILIFPDIVKAGFVFGGAYGEGELISGSKLDGYYNSVAGSWGLQVGAQSFGYVVFLMTESAVRYIHQTHGLEIGVGPTVVVVNEGVAKNLSTSTLKDDAYAFIFDQKGLMVGLTLEGTKISRIHEPT
jgi:lipid-binding SYLF domain-containing protein